jgi:hypothetical protein
MSFSTFDILETLVSAVRCKPGWQFSLRKEDGALRLVIMVTGPNSRALPEDITARHYFPVPIATYNEKTWRRWIFERCRGVENHELGEFFMIGDERPFAPLHGPGEDPYTVHEFRDEVDARTVQDGSTIPTDDYLRERRATNSDWDGLPPNPDQTGAHWLRYNGTAGGGEKGHLALYEWSELTRTWSYFGVSGTDGPERMAAHYTYVGKCLPPAT